MVEESRVSLRESNWKESLDRDRHAQLRWENAESYRVERERERENPQGGVRQMILE